MDLAAVIKAASTPLHIRRPSIPRILLLQRDQPRGGDPDGRQSSGTSGGGGGGRSAIRGIDCVRPSFLSGRKRTSLGIIEVRHERRAPPGRWESSGGGGGGRGGGSNGDGDGEEGAGGREREASASELGGEGARSGGGRKGRSKRSGAACRKRRRQFKKARQLKAAAVAAAASLSPAVVLPGGAAVVGASGQTDEGKTAESLVAAAITEG